MQQLLIPALYNLRQNGSMSFQIQEMGPMWPPRLCVKSMIFFTWV